MIEIVTLEEAKQFMRVDGDYEDATILMLIGAATESVMAVADGWLAATAVPDRLKLAVMTHVSRAFDNREDGADTPPSAVRLLSPLRVLDI